jgi:toxin CcdB
MVDCQADTLRDIGTRIVAPLLPQSRVSQVLPRLHPAIEFEGEALLLVTHLLSAIPTRELGPAVGSLADREYEVLNALDMLLTGV